MQHGSDDLKRGSVAMKRSMFKQSYALHSASRAAQSSHTPSCFFFFFFLLHDLFVFKKEEENKTSKKSIWEPKRWERFNPQNVRTQTRRQGSGQRSNGPELSPFRLRTSEVPLCAALHLFYPSSLIRPGRPRDPGARVTCQMTVYSWARGLDARSTFVLPGRREEGGSLLQCDTKKIQQTWKNKHSQWVWNEIMFHRLLTSAFVRQSTPTFSCTDDIHVWNVPVYSQERGKQMPARAPIESYLHK